MHAARLTPELRGRKLRMLEKGLILLDEQINLRAVAAVECLHPRCEYASGGGGGDSGLRARSCSAAKHPEDPLQPTSHEQSPSRNTAGCMTTGKQVYSRVNVLGQSTVGESRLCVLPYPRLNSANMGHKRLLLVRRRSARPCLASG